MKRLIPAVLCLALLTSCGGSTHSKRADELEAKNTALSDRVKNLEGHLLDAQKQLIAQQQALQNINQRMRQIENYFDKLQSGQGR